MQPFGQAPGTVQVGKLHTGIVGRKNDPLPPRPVGGQHTAVDDVGGADRLVCLHTGGVDPDPHVDRHLALHPTHCVGTLPIDIGVGVHPGLDQLIPRRLVEPQQLVHDRRHLLRSQVAQERTVEVAHLFDIDLARLVLVGDRLDPVRVAGLFEPGPLGLAQRVEMVAVPHIEPKLKVGVAPFDLAIQLAVEIFVALKPEALPDQTLRVAQQHTQKLDQRTVHKVVVGACTLEKVVNLQKGLARPFHIDPARLRLTTAVGTKAAGRQPGDQLVERAASLVAPHDAVDRIAAALILDHRMPPEPIVRVVGARLLAMAAQQVHLQTLGQIGDRDCVGRAVPGIFEKRLHQLGHHAHAAAMGLWNHLFENVNPLQDGVARPEILDERVGIKRWVGVEIGAPLHREWLGHPVVGPAVQLMRDAASGLEPQPRDGPNHQHVDAGTLLQGLQHRLDPLVDKADRADLNAYKFLSGHSRSRLTPCSR